MKKELIHENPRRLLLSGLLALFAPTPVFAAEVIDLEPLVVTGDLLGATTERLPASAAVLDHLALANEPITHFDDLIGRVPNLNWAGGTSRPRFFQIRGIGENSQFGNEIPASSVGFIIDGIDFSGLGGVASLFDLQQVEVLRGPQAAAFGANALAGMVILRTRDPELTASGRVELGIGSDDLRSVAVASGGPLGDPAGSSLAYRISLQRHRENGFRENSFLGREDTHARDEDAARLKLAWTPADRLQVNLTLLYFDFDNGYDAWALDNDSFHTSTDEPGRDQQESAAAGIEVIWSTLDDLDLAYRASFTRTDSLYGYDWDWSNVAELQELYGPEVYWGTEYTDRERGVQTHDLRLSSDRFAGGIYLRELLEDQDYFGVTSRYRTRAAAAYAQGLFALTDALSLTLAGRLENVDIAFADSLGSDLDDSETVWGGKIALEYRLNPSHGFYGTIDRGFKAGGVNLDDDIPAGERVYDTETLWNFELGWHGFFRALNLEIDLALFHMERRDIQIDSSIQLGDGSTFALYKDNAASGHNQGAELELRWSPAENWSFRLAAGLLRAEFDDYRYIDPVDGTSLVVLDGRDQAYAPRFNWSAGVEYRFAEGFFAGFDVEGRDDYVFDVASGQEIEGYTLANARIGYQSGPWRFVLWIGNVFDTRYDVRGFFFANEPPFYDQPRRWVSQGDPRQIGLTVSRSW